MINSFILNTNQLILYGYCNEKIDVDKDSSLPEEAIFVHLQEEIFQKKIIIRYDKSVQFQLLQCNRFSNRAHFDPDFIHIFNQMKKIGLTNFSV